MQPAEEFALDPAGTGGRAWFEAAFHRHYPRLVGLLTRLTGDRGQAEELAADVLAKVNRRPPALRSPEDLEPWLYRVAANAGLDAVRANTRRRRHEDAASAEQARTTSIADALSGVLQRERCARVRSVLARLKPRDAELLLLRADGLAYREIAQALGVQPGSVGTLLARAEAEFERRYRARYGDDV